MYMCLCYSTCIDIQAIQGLHINPPPPHSVRTTHTCIHYYGYNQINTQIQLSTCTCSLALSHPSLSALHAKTCVQMKVHVISWARGYMQLCKYGICRCPWFSGAPRDQQCNGKNSGPGVHVKCTQVSAILWLIITCVTVLLNKGNQQQTSIPMGPYSRRTTVHTIVFSGC